MTRQPVPMCVAVSVSPNVVEGQGLHGKDSILIVNWISPPLDLDLHGDVLYLPERPMTDSIAGVSVLVLSAVEHVQLGHTNPTGMVLFLRLLNLNLNV